MRAASRITVSWPWREAAWWHSKAPSILPRPMALIFWRPLPKVGLAKSVWGFTRLTRTTASASSASRAVSTRKPWSVFASSAVSTFDTMRAPTVASVMPRVSSTSTWPGAVPPPWLPIAGITKGRAPADRSAATTAATTSA